MPHVCMRSPPMHHVPSCKSDTALVPHIYLLFVCVHLCRVSGGVAASSRGLGALSSVRFRESDRAISTQNIPTRLSVIGPTRDAAHNTFSTIIIS